MSRSVYEKRVLRVLAYIHDNLDGDLSLDTLADVAAMSRFHWHRTYRAISGETLAQTVRRVRLHRASCWLLHTDQSIGEIARRCGDENAQSFSRKFRDAYGLSPVAFRKRGTFPVPVVQRQNEELIMYDVTIKQLPQRALWGMPHTGPYLEIGSKFEQVGALFASRDLWSSARGMAGLYFDDPGSTPEQELRSFAGMLVGPEAGKPDEPLEARELSAGKYAVLTFKGPYSGLREAYEYLYGAWLPQSGEEPRDEPASECYLNDPSNTAPEELLTEICLPLK